MGTSPSPIIMSRESDEEFVEQGAQGRIFRRRDKAFKEIEVCTQKNCVVYEQKACEYLSRRSHENICQLYNYDFSSDGRFLRVYMEYIHGQDLLLMLEKQRSYLSVKECFHLFIQILKGVEFLHANRIAHRDLKCENIMVTHTNVVKIIDFGLSKLVDMTYPSFCEEDDFKCGTVSYAPPEIWDNQPEKCPFKADVWCLGVCLFAIAFKALPFLDANPKFKNQPSRFCVLQHQNIHPWNTLDLIYAQYKPYKLSCHSSIFRSSTFRQILHASLQRINKSRPTVSNMLQYLELKSQSSSHLNSTKRKVHDDKENFPS